MQIQESPEGICSFWFGEEADDGAIARRQGKLWWQKSAETDAVIRQRFEPTLRSAGAGELDHWARTPRGRLALVIVLDQFPRNIYRDQPQAFAFDAKALALSLAGLEQGDDKPLRLIQRVFLYMPLEHAESPEMQARSVAAFEDLLAEAPPSAKDEFETFLDFAVRHRDIIERFGRFPHRNAILGRESTAAEHAFLQQPGSGF